MAAMVAPPEPARLLAPLLPALPAAAVSKEPAVGVLPFLSPILRQRVQLLASSSTEPWLRLLCYDTSKAAKLGDLVLGGTLEPHPVSGEVEIDWDYDSETRYRRRDEETLQALVVLSELGLAFQLIYCINDADGGGDGWRVGEVTVPDKPSPFAQFGGYPTLAEAEKQFKEGQTGVKSPTTDSLAATRILSTGIKTEDEDDGGYWAQYDATPSQTPVAEKGGFEPSGRQNVPGAYDQPAPEEEEDYYARYDSVQPAMDNHDPDEEAQAARVAPPLGLSKPAEPTPVRPVVNVVDDDEDERRRREALVHPRPESSASSNGSHTVAKLEATAGKQEQNEFGVKQHISRSIRSLFLLSRASGIDREEFERLVKTELDILGMVEEEEDQSN